MKEGPVKPKWLAVRIANWTASHAIRTFVAFLFGMAVGMVVLAAAVFFILASRSV